MKLPYVTSAPIELTKVGIIGYGVVGKATEASITFNNDIDVLIYDPNIQEHSDASVLTQMQKECFAVFICLNADIGEDGEQELSEIIRYGKMFEASLATMSRAIIRSTLSEKSLIKLYHNVLSFFYFPEFLREAFSDIDAIHPIRLVLGGPVDNVMYKYYANDLIDMFANESDAPVYITTLDEAVEIKILANYFLAAKTVLVHDIIEKAGGLTPRVIGAITSDERIGHYGFDTSKGLGAGGKCFIKDLHLMDVCEDSSVHKAIIERNYELLQLSGKDKELADKYRRIYTTKETKND